MMVVYHNQYPTSDPPHFALGYEAQLSDKVYAPWANPECKTPEQVIAAFKPWVSSYYDHPQCSVQSLDELDVRKRAYHATTDRWTAEELDGNISDQSGLRSDFPMCVTLALSFLIPSADTNMQVFSYDAVDNKGADSTRYA